MGNIRSRLLLLTILIFTLQIGILAIAYFILVAPQVNQLEKNLVEKNLYRDLGFIHRELLQLERIAQVISQQQRFKPETQELFVKEMLHFEINFMTILNQNNQVTFEKIIDLNSEASYPHQPFISILWDKRPAFFRHNSDTSIYSGLFSSALGPMLIVSLPVYKDKVNTGTMIIGRIISNDVINMIRTLTYDDMKLLPLETFAKQKDNESILNKLLNQNQDQIIETSPDRQEGYMILRDFNQDPSLILTSSINRTYSALGFKTFIEAILFLLAIEVLFLLFCYYIIQKFMINPLNQLIIELNDPHFEISNLQVTSQTKSLRRLRTAMFHLFVRQKEVISHQMQRIHQDVLAMTHKYYIEEIESILHAIQDGIRECDMKLSTLPINDLEWIIATHKSGKLSEAALNAELQKLTHINDKLREFQQETRQKLFDLHNKFMRNVASIKVQIRSNITWKEFTPISNS